MIENLWQREVEFINVINAMECRGVLVDQEMCRHEVAIGESRMFNVRKDIKADPGSNKDLKRLLIDELGLPVVKRSEKTGKPSFDKFAMAEYDEMLEHRHSDLAKRIFEYRGWQKAIGYYNSFLKHVSHDGRIRTTYWVNGTVTGRLSSSDPNLQQIPKSQNDPHKKPWNNKMKRVFLAPDLFELLFLDFGQIEFRLGAAYSGEEILLDAFNDPSRHVFKEMSRDLNRDYNQCKTFTYATLYGAQWQKIGQILGLEEDDARDFYKSFHERHPKLMALSEAVYEKARSRGYIKLWTGRRRHLPTKQDAKKAFNSLLQGGGAEVVKSAMIRVKKRVDKEGYYKMLLNVHDSIGGESLISERDNIIKLISEEMTRVTDEYDFGVRFTVAPEFWGPKVA